MIFEESIENKRFDIKHLKILMEWKMKWKNKSNFILLLVQKHNNFEFYAFFHVHILKGYHLFLGV